MQSEATRNTDYTALRKAQVWKLKHEILVRMWNNRNFQTL